MSKVMNVAENAWLIKTRNRMKQRLRNGKTGYVQSYMERVNYNEPATEQFRHLTLEGVYDRFAVFAITTLWGTTHESYTFDVIRETMQEA